MSRPESVEDAGCAGERPFLRSRSQVPVVFIPNLGQTDPAVRYIARCPRLNLFLTADEAVFVLWRQTVRGSLGGQSADAPSGTTVIRLQFVGQNPSVEVEAREAPPGRVNLFVGRDPAAWRTGIPTFGEVWYRDLWPGIDLVFRAGAGAVKSEFHLRPGARVEDIRFLYEGVETPGLDESGNLLLPTDLGTLIEERPCTYQQDGDRQVPVDSRFALLTGPLGETVVTFALDGAVAVDGPIVIDPVLAYSTYLGGSDVDEAFSIAIDTEGNAYVTGQTKSADFPTKAALQPHLGGPQHFDAFVSKFNPAGTALVFSTYLGGSLDDAGNRIVLGGDGSIFIGGQTASPDFPVTANAFQTHNAGRFDAFVTKLDPSGAHLIYSTYLGGALDDLGLGLAVDGDGNAYVAGSTTSPDFPTENAFQPHLAGGMDAFAAKLNPGGTGLVYSTYLGGTGDDEALSMALDPARNAYVTGNTNSTDYPTKNPFQAQLAGGLDALVTKLDPSGADLVYSTYLGGAAEDDGLDITVDASGFAYLTGRTQSTDFPTANPLQPMLAGDIDAFVARFDQTGEGLVFSTYLGGTNEDIAAGIALDGRGNVWVSGNTQSTDFPTQDPIQAQYAGNIDGFVAELTAAGSALLFSTYLGGTDLDNAVRVVADPMGNAYITGATGSTDFPTTPGVFQPQFAGGALDAFVAKIATQVVVPAQFTSGLFIITREGVQPPGFHPLALHVLVSSFSDMEQSIAILVNQLTESDAKVTVLEEHVGVPAEGAVHVILDLDTFQGRPLEVIFGVANPPSAVGLAASAAGVKKVAADGATVPLVFIAPEDFAPVAATTADEASAAPMAIFTSGLFQAPIAPGGVRPKIHILLSNFTGDPQIAEVVVRELLPDTTQKATIFTQVVSVPASGGRQITLDAHDMGIEGQWIEVDFTVPLDSSGEALLEPSVQVMNLFLSDGTTEELLFMSPEDLQRVAAANGVTPTPPAVAPAPQGSPLIQGLLRHPGTRGATVPGSVHVGRNPFRPDQGR